MRIGILGALIPIVLAGCGSGSNSAPKVLRVAIGTDPASFDPGRAADQPSANIVINIGDPLVKLGVDFEAVPSLARSWEWSPDEKTITFHLRDDGRWTNGDPVTADDFEWSWKRVLSPELGADYAYQLYSIRGARAYNECAKTCAPLRDRVGIHAIDDHTIRVALESPQPWFPQQVAHHAFLAVHRPTVERFPKTWTDPAHIVTNGPFKLRSWTHDKSVVLVKNTSWRGAANVWLDRVVLPIVPAFGASLRAFRRGEVDATAGDLPPDKNLTPTGDEARYPFAQTTYYGFNLRNISDLNQRRAMAFASDRPALIRSTTLPTLPATGLIPPSMPGFETITQGFLSPAVDLVKARAYMRRARHPKRSITLVLNDSPDVARTADIAQAAWAKLGIKTKIKVLEWAQFLDAVGPPPSPSVDVVQIGWAGDFIDAYNFFQILGCRSEYNWWNYCDRSYDELLHETTRVRDQRVRCRIYAQLEARLTGPHGLLPIVPTLWYTVTALEKPPIRKTFNVNPLLYFDLAQVRPTG